MTNRAGRRCQLCVLHEGVPDVVVDDDGVCNHCRSAAHFPRSRDSLRVERLLNECRARNLPVVVGFSGGNDSAACLAHLARNKDIRCIAVLVDNGFIPEAVIERARALARRLEVVFQVEVFDLLERLPSVTCSPCERCIDEVIRRLARAAVQHHAGAIASGHLYGPGLVAAAHGSVMIPRIAPLFAEGVGEDARHALLLEVGWREDIRYASSTNCTLLGFVEYVYSRQWGYSPVIGEIAHEVRAGTLEREQALAHLSRPKAWLPEYSDVERRFKGRMRAQ